MSKHHKRNLNRRAKKEICNYLDNLSKELKDRDKNFDYLNKRKLWWKLYIIQIDTDIVYVGITTDVPRRLEEHKKKYQNFDVKLLYAFLVEPKMTYNEAECFEDNVFYIVKEELKKIGINVLGSRFGISLNNQKFPANFIFSQSGNIKKIPKKSIICRLHKIFEKQFKSI